MSAFTANATKETGSVAITGTGDWISLHTASPGTTGANEATGGTPTYARKQTTWTAGGSDGIVAGSQVTHDVPAGTYTHFGVWTAVSGGTYKDGGPLSSSPVMGAQGQIKTTPTHTQS